MGRFPSVKVHQGAFLTAVLLPLSVWLFQPALHAGSNPSGKLRGILTAKSTTWLEIKVDGESTSRRLIPTWRGGLPKQGGGLDAYVLSKMKSLRTGNRLEVHWVML